MYNIGELPFNLSIGLFNLKAYTPLIPSTRFSNISQFFHVVKYVEQSISMIQLYAGLISLSWEKFLN